MLNRHRPPDPRRKPDEFAPQVSEGCCVGDMIWLAVRMSEAGIGDYWEDVDQCVRNHLVEHQLIRRDLLEATIAAGRYTVNKGYPLYLRDFYRAAKAPLRTVERYVAPRLI